MGKGRMCWVSNGVSGQSEPRAGVQNKAGMGNESRFPSTVASDSSHTLGSGNAGSWCSNSASVPPPRRMSLGQGLCECGHWSRSVPSLPIKARVFPSVIFDDVCECMYYFVASAACLLWGRGWG